MGEVSWATSAIILSHQHKHLIQGSSSERKRGEYSGTSEKRKKTKTNTRKVCLKDQHKGLGPRKTLLEDSPGDCRISKRFLYWYLV